MNKLVFGTAGVPLSSAPRTTIDGIKRVKELSLGAMELEFVRNVNITKEKAPLVKKAAEKEGIELTCHGQYFINLNSLEKSKVIASIQRVLNAARIAHLCSAKSLTFHAAYYMEQSKEEVYKTVKSHLKEILQTLKSEGNTITIRPETTGKESQFGSIHELIQLSSELDNVMPCIDFAHLHARSGGKYNTYEEFCKVLEEVEKKLGKEALNNMHIHIAGIEYTQKGERRHLNLKESDFKYKELARAWKTFNIKGVVISESPNIEDDALLMKKTYEVI